MCRGDSGSACGGDGGREGAVCMCRCGGDGGKESAVSYIPSMSSARNGMVSGSSTMNSSPSFV